MNWSQLLVIGAKAAIGGLFGDPDLDWVEHIGDGGTHPTVDVDLGFLDAPSSTICSVGGTPWFANIVDETKSDIVKIESGDWTDADQAALSADLQHIRSAVASERAFNHASRAHLDSLSVEKLRSAQDGLFHASHVANDAHTNYESAILSGEREAIRAASGQLGAANASVELAAKYLKSMKSLIQ